MRKRMILTGLLASGFFATGMGADPGTHEPVGTELHAEEYVVGAMNAKPEKVLEAEASERAIKIERTSTATPTPTEDEEEKEDVVVVEEEAKAVVEPVATPTPTPTITEEPEPEPVVTVEPEPVIEYSEEPEPVMEEEVVVEEPVVEYSEEPVAVAVEEEPVVEVEEEVEEEPVPTPTVSATETPAATVEESVSVWDELAECESGGDWTIVSADGRFHGGLQFTVQSWDAMGGQEFAVRPENASKAEQIAVAERLQAEQGWGAWPLCSQKIGLR